MNHMACSCSRFYARSSAVLGKMETNSSVGSERESLSHAHVSPQVGRGVWALVHSGSVMVMVFGGMGDESNTLRRDGIFTHGSLCIRLFRRRVRYSANAAKLSYRACVNELAMTNICLHTPSHFSVLKRRRHRAAQRARTRETLLKAIF